MTESRQVVCSRETARAGSNDQYPFSGRRRVDRYLPAPLHGKIAQEALDSVDRHGAVELPPIAVGLARMVADPTMDGRERVVEDQCLPGLLKLVCLRQGQPRLDVLSRRASIVAGRKQVHVERTPRP